MVSENTSQHEKILMRIVSIFDRDETAGAFLSEDGDGGFGGAIYRMAREIDRLRSITAAEQAEPAPAARTSVVKMRELLQEIGAKSRALRKGGPDPMDLHELSDALEEAIDLAVEADGILSALEPAEPAPEAEPVAWLVSGEGPGWKEHGRVTFDRETAEAKMASPFYTVEALYKAPPEIHPTTSEARLREATPEDALAAEILAELTRARAKFPGRNVTFAALIEEVGELATATFEEASSRVRKEAVQVAVMAMRMVLDGDHTFDEWRKEKGLDPLHSSARKLKSGGQRMTDSDLEDMRSDKAIVARRQVHSDVGGATIFCVVLADGFIVECGSDGYAERRAKLLASAVNETGAHRFTTAFMQGG